MGDGSTLTGVVKFVAENGAQIAEWTLLTIGLFGLIATRTKNKSDDKIVDFFYKVVNFLGANVGKAKNDPNES